MQRYYEGALFMVYKSCKKIKIDLHSVGKKNKKEVTKKNIGDLNESLDVRNIVKQGLLIIKAYC